MNASVDTKEWYQKIVKIQYGENGAFINAIFERNSISPLIGTRIDIPLDITTNLSNVGEVVLSTSGNWTIFEIEYDVTKHVFYATLIRGGYNEANFGDGKMYKMSDLANLYNYGIFGLSEYDYVFTMSNNVRVYKTIVQMAKKISRSKLPIFKLDGSVMLASLNERGLTIETDQIFAAVGPNTYPSYREKPAKADYDYELYGQLGEPIRLSGYYLEPGKIYSMTMEQPFGFISKNGSTEVRYICRDVIIEKSGDNYKATSILSRIIEHTIHPEDSVGASPLSSDISKVNEEYQKLEEKRKEEREQERALEDLKVIIDKLESMNIDPSTMLGIPSADLERIKSGSVKPSELNIPNLSSITNSFTMPQLPNLTPNLNTNQLNIFPGLSGPNLPSISLPGVSIPSNSNFINIPNIPNMPNMPNMPSMPNTPNMPNIPNMPDMPNTPNMPNMFDTNNSSNNP
ncbi:MAG: hypothetical protein QW255_05300 [Candidatus Bilamarchaeaceae archaeon]